MAKRRAYFSFIELLATWEGSVATRDLITQFALSAPQAKRVLNEYNRSFPSQLYYCESRKKFLPTRDFVAQSPFTFDYFAWLIDGVLRVRDRQEPAVFAVINANIRVASPTIVCPLMQAIRQNLRLEIDYVSINTPVSQGRVIQPHSIVRTAQRYHVRAFDELHQQFRDFVISRFRGTPELCGKASHTIDDDIAWSTYVDIQLTPDTRLSDEQRQVIAEDYGMQNNVITFTCRGPLVQYTLDELQVKTKFHDANPAAQQLVLVNYATVKPWLFDS